MKIKILILAAQIFVCCAAIAQTAIPTSDALSITGEIKNPTTFSVSELDTFPRNVINDLIIYNHNGEVRDTLTRMGGIPLKSLLAPLQYNNDRPTQLNEFYFVFTATDGYKVVFSWNEIFNTETGNNFFIVTEADGKELSELDHRIMFVATADLISGRRFIKGLQKIEVRRVE
jgi:hypothetical protein